MDNAYWNQFRNGNLRSVILDRRNLHRLEALIAREQSEYERLEVLAAEEKLAFGEKIPVEGLEGVCNDVYARVTAFLDTPDIKPPSYSYKSMYQLKRRLDKTSVDVLKSGSAVFLSGTFLDIYVHLSPNDNPLMYLLSHLFGKSAQFLGLAGMALGVSSVIEQRFFPHWGGHHYHCIDKHVFLRDDPETVLVPSVAHEVSHHIQQESIGECLMKDSKKVSPLKRFLVRPISDELFSVFLEGHARGVERHFAQVYRDETDNEAFLYGATKVTLQDLQRTYVWLCRRLRIQPKEILLQPKDSLIERGADLMFSNILGRPEAHSLGTTLSSLWEEEYGNRIYRN